jgi:hypothetical protein
MLANKAFQRGDNFTGGAAMAEIGATLVTMVGKMIGSAAGPLSLAGPVGGLLGALFSVVSLVLGVLGQKQTSIVDDIEKIMRTINAEDKDGKLNASFKNLKDFERELLWSITLREGELSENSEQNNRPGRALPVDIVRQINLIDGPMKQAIGEVESWLLERKNQELEAWPAILERHCSMYLYLIRVLLLYAAAKRGNEIKQVTLVDIPTLGQREAEFLKAVLPAARNRGIFWHTGTVADKDTIGRTVFERAHLYTRDVGVSARGAAWKSLGGEIMALMPSSALAPQLCDASARSGYRPAPHPTAAGAREPTEHEPLPPRGRPRAACHREPPGRSGVTGGSGSTAMSRPPLEVADVVRQHGAAFLQRYGPTLSGEQHRALRAIAVCRTATLRGPYHPV